MTSAISRIASLIACLGFPILGLAQTTYSYDSGGRLTKVTYGPSNSIVYAYDAAGNLISRSVQSGPAPLITSVSTSNGGSAIAQNTFVVVKGNNLTPATTPAAGVIWSTASSFAAGQMPTQLGDVSVTVNGKAAYIYFYCSAVTSTVCTTDQINILTPLDTATGSVQVVVTNGSAASAPYIAQMQPVAPAFLLFGATRYVAATHADSSLIGPTSLYPGLSTPAQPGEVVVIYAVGFGLTSTPLTPGSATQAGSLPTPPACTIGGTTAPVVFAGLIAPGLYQLNIQVPGAAASGDNPISCAYGNTVTPPGDLVSVANQ